MTRKIKYRTFLNKQGQFILEFTFTMIIILLMIFGIMMIFRWTGLDLLERQRQHDKTLTISAQQNYSKGQKHLGPLKQVEPFFSEPMPMNAIWDGDS